MTKARRLLARCPALIAAGLALALAALPVSGAEGQGSQDAHVRVAFSRRTMGIMNRADVTAAMKLWLQSMARERGLDLNPTVEVFETVEEMAGAIRQARVDVLSLRMDEFLFLEKRVPLVGHFASQVNHKVTEQYVLLVRRDRAIAGLRDLKGETLMVLDTNRAALAPFWLDTELVGSRLPVAARFFSKVTLAQRQVQAILPVFFKQAGAALVTRNSFDLACELNPQLAKDLRVLLISPELVPAIGAYRANANSSAVAFYRREGLRVGETPAGKNFLDLFQTDGIVELSAADMAGTRAFMANYARIGGKGIRP